MAKSDADILREARALIENPARWTQKTYARGKSGRPVLPAGPAAVCWCALGALHKITNAHPLHDPLPAQPVDHLAKGAEEINAWAGIDNINDDEGHAAVLRMFDRAIELAEQSPTEAAQ